MALPIGRRYASAAKISISEDRVIVFDTETAPDLYAARRLLGLEPDTPAAHVRHAIGRLYAREGESPDTCFLKPVMHCVLALSGIELVRPSSREPWLIERSHCLHLGEMEEAAQLEAFDSWLETGPRLVGFNIFGFDLPLLRMRSLAFGLALRNLCGLAGRDYWYRFGHDRIDLCDLLSNYGAMPKPSLSEAAALFGIRAKSGLDGADVEGLAADGRYSEISAYCTRDVIVTAHLFLRWELATGGLSKDRYRISHDNLADHCRTLRLQDPIMRADPLWIST
jgi:predicted PolB exonuclease-like 3'-5' exonuclease